MTNDGGTPESPRQPRGLLPGIVGIAGCMLVTAFIGAVGAARGIYGTRNAAITVASIAGLLFVGSVGLLLLRRWGYALVLAATVLSSSYYLFAAMRLQQSEGYLLAALQLIFFLYLVRPEVRSRMH